MCSLVFPNFLYKDVELQCANYEKAHFSKKKFLGPKMPKNAQKQGLLDLVKNCKTKKYIELSRCDQRKSFTKAVIQGC